MVERVERFAAVDIELERLHSPQVYDGDQDAIAALNPEQTDLAPIARPLTSSRTPFLAIVVSISPPFRSITTMSGAAYAPVTPG